MNKFKTQLKLIEEALLKPMSDERAQELDDEKIKIQIDEIKKRSTLNKDGTYDVDGNVYLDSMGLTEIPLKFGKVNGNFSCSNNSLTNLVGSPIEVNGGFYCYNNQLTSLIGCPKYVGYDFWCDGFTKKDIKQVCKVEGEIIV